MLNRCATVSNTWRFEPVWGAGNQDTPPPQCPSAVGEYWFAVRCIINFWGIVLIPVLSPHSHGEVHRGQQAQHGADNQSCGVPVIHHGREEDSSLGEQTQSAVSNEVWLPEMEG